MDESNNIFNINNLLRTLFHQVEEHAGKNRSELLIQMDPIVPKLLRGDEKRLLHFFTKLLDFVFTNSSSSEIVVTVRAPDDFVYEENVIFEIPHIDLLNDKSLMLLNALLENDLEVLNGKMEKNTDNSLHISIPFTLHELGFRRHYRLPDKSMLDKRVLIRLKSRKLAEAIKTHFQYFHYDIDVENVDRQSDFETYDIVVTEKGILTETSLQNLNSANTQSTHIIYIEGPECDSQTKEENILCKPVTQENIHLLICKLFGSAESVTKATNEPKNLGEELHKADKKVHEILDEGIFKQNKDKAMEFLKKFEDSDIRFREFVKEKNIKAIKQCCSEAEIYAKSIGAERMLDLLEMVQLVLESGENDMLAIFPHKYHKELKKLKDSITR